MLHNETLSQTTTENNLERSIRKARMRAKVLGTWKKQNMTHSFTIAKELGKERTIRCPLLVV